MTETKNISAKNKKDKAVKSTKTKPVPKDTSVSFDRKELEAALNTARDFIETRATMPILTHVLLKAPHVAGKDVCQLTATDLEKSWTKVIPCKGSSIDICIPLAVLLREVKALHSEITEVKLRFSEKSVNVNGRCEILTLPGNEFPKLTECKGVDIDIPDLPGKLNRVLPAAGDKDTRYVLNAIMLDTRNGHLVATDGHRLHLETVPSSKEGKQIIIPRETAHVAVKYLASNIISIDCAEQLISFSLDGGIMVSRLIEGTYPDYKVVIPKEKPKKIKFQGSEFLKILEGALPLVTSGNAIKMSVNGRIDIETRNPDLGNYRWHIPCESEGIKGFIIGFNAQYLIDAIKSFTTKEDNNVLMELKDPLSPCLINGKAVVMPIRI